MVWTSFSHACTFRNQGTQWSLKSSSDSLILWLVKKQCLGKTLGAHWGIQGIAPCSMLRSINCRHSPSTALPPLVHSSSACPPPWRARACLGSEICELKLKLPSCGNILYTGKEGPTLQTLCVLTRWSFILSLAYRRSSDDHFNHNLDSHCLLDKYKINHSNKYLLR